jgi:hypothetical protein
MDPYSSVSDILVKALFPNWLVRARITYVPDLVSKKWSWCAQLGLIMTEYTNLMVLDALLGVKSEMYAVPLVDFQENLKRDAPELLSVQNMFTGKPSGHAFPLDETNWNLFRKGDIIKFPLK